MKGEGAAVRVHEGVTLSPHDLLARIVAAWAPGLRRLRALAVDNGCRRARLTSDTLAVGHDESMVHPPPTRRHPAETRTSDTRSAKVGSCRAATATSSPPAARRRSRSQLPTSATRGVVHTVAAEARAAPASATRHPLGRSHSAGPPGYAAFCRLVSTCSRWEMGRVPTANQRCQDPMSDLLTENEAYRAMYLFLLAYWRRTASSDIAALRGEISLLDDGTPADPAIVGDFRLAIKQAKGSEPTQLFMSQPS